MYHASLPVFINGLNNLSTILTKAVAYAESKKIDPTILLNSRLAPDMFPLTRQVQITTDMVKGCAARLSGVENPVYPDTETSFDELQARIQKTIDFLNSFKASSIDGTEEKKIHLKVGKRELNWTGQNYLLHFVIPNFYFHITAAYAILRHNGLDIGKAEYLGKL